MVLVWLSRFKERLSPAAEIWVRLIADVIVEEVLRERRAEAADNLRPDVAVPVSRPGRPERTGIARNDHGEKVVAPRGRLLTIQEAADYLGLSRTSLAGRG